MRLTAMRPAMKQNFIDILNIINILKKVFKINQGFYMTKAFRKAIMRRFQL